MNLRSRPSIAILLNVLVTLALVAFLIHHTGSDRWGAALISISILTNGAILYRSRHATTPRDAPSSTPKEF